MKRAGQQLGLFFAPMLTHARHRHLTRWPRRLAFGFVTALILLGLWRCWQAMHPQPLPAPAPTLTA